MTERDGPARHPLASKTSATLALLAALVALPYALPHAWGELPLPGGRRLSLRLLTPPAPAQPAAAPVDEQPLPVGSVLLVDTTEAQEESPTPGGVAAPFAPGGGAARAPVQLDGKGVFLDPTGKALAPLFEQMKRVDAKEPGARARVVFYGDSIVAFDQVTDTLRRKLIDRFGDGGRGFVLPVNAWPSYYQNDVSRFASSGWMASRIVGPLAPDGHYGLGGVSFQAAGGGMALMATSQRGSYCRTASRFVVSYAAQPGGGELTYRVDSDPPRTLSTQAAQLEDRVEEVTMPDGPHRLELRTAGGPVRLYGVELLRDAPGVTLDALGIIGARLRQMELFDEAAWAAQIRRAKPSMMVVGLGINDVSDGVRGVKAFEEYDDAAERVLRRVRAAAPEAACLVMGPLDRGAGGSDPYTNRGIAGRVNTSLRRISLAHGCAYFDVFTLMGGAGGMADWARKGLGGADYMHPSHQGAELLGNLLATELIGRYEAWRGGP